MQLGAIFSSSVGEPLVTWPVEFHLLKMTSAGHHRIRVKANLHPVSESDRVKAIQEATKWLQTDPGSPYRIVDGESPLEIPETTKSMEVLYKFLSYALYDEDDSMKKFVGPKDYGYFRSGLVQEQVYWLYSEYKKFIEQEYPELITQVQKNELVDEALGK